METNCRGCSFHKFPYKAQSPIRVGGSYPIKTFNNKEDVWEVTKALMKEISETINFHDACYSLSKQIPIYSCPKIFKDSKYDRDINRYYYCKEMNTSPYEGSFDKQPAKWVEKYYIIKGAYSKIEEVAIKKANKKGN